MSLSIKYGRAGLGAAARPGGAMGDPGLFGFLGKVVKGAAGAASKILPGPLGAAAGLISRAVPGGVRSTAMTIRPPSPALAGLGGGLAGGAIAKMLGPGRGSFPVPGTGIQINPGDIFPGGAPFLSGREGSAQACPAGYRKNKTAYFLKSGEYVPKESRCVRVRRRNNLNQRALTRAMGRVEGFKKAATRAGRITIRQPAKCK